LAIVVTIAGQHVEGVELHLVVVPAGMQVIEVGNAIGPK
jgi:hypothetical protein